MPKQQTFNGRPIPYIQVNSIPVLPLLPGVTTSDAESLWSRPSSSSSTATLKSLASTRERLPVHPPQIPGLPPLAPLSEGMFSEEMMASHTQQDSAADVALPADTKQSKPLIGDLLLDVIDEGPEDETDLFSDFTQTSPLGDSEDDIPAVLRNRYGNPLPQRPLRITNPDTIPTSPPTFTPRTSIDSVAESTHSAFSFAPSALDNEKEVENSVWLTRLRAREAIDQGSYIDRRNFRIRQIQMEARQAARTPVRRNGYSGTERALGLLEGEK